MDSQMLRDIEIKGFRVFRSLRIDNLGQVNLVVGKNNVGKSYFLEALNLYSYRGAPSVISELLVGREELSYRAAYRAGADRFPRAQVDHWVKALENMHHGRPPIDDIDQPVQIGPIGSPDKALTISLVWYSEQANEEKAAQLRLEPIVNGLDVDPQPSLRVQYGDSNVILSIDRLERWASRRLGRADIIPDDIEKCLYISSAGLNGRQIGSLWDDVTLTDLEGEVVRALRIVAPTVDRVSLVGDELGSSGDRTVLVKVKNSDRRITLRSMGDGMIRMLGIALSLVEAQGGLLLIDEIENGIHYSVLGDVWRLVFELASRLHIQVFATTHSWDCIEAFQTSASEAQIDGNLIRLELSKGENKAVVFGEHDLKIATREQIEVR